MHNNCAVASGFYTDNTTGGSTTQIAANASSSVTWQMSSDNTVGACGDVQHSASSPVSCVSGSNCTNWDTGLMCFNQPNCNGLFQPSSSTITGGVFATPGTYGYYCTFHGTAMQGTVIVSGGATHLQISGVPASGTAGNTFSITVTALDAGNRTA